MMFVGIAGHARAGKDEFAKSLALRGRYHTMGMSDALVEMAITLNPLLFDEKGEAFYLRDVIETLGYVTAKQIPSVRSYLQVLGTDAVRRVLGDDAWIRAAERRFVALLQEGRNVAITGIRFGNEAEMIRAYGGVVVRIERPNVHAVNGHVSDAQTFAVDKVIFNDGTLQDLALKAQGFINGE